MKFSEQWLREWVDPPLATDDLAEQLTMAGLEVDSISTAADPFSGVVVGEVLSTEPHPNAERLKVCQVDIGAADALKGQLPVGLVVLKAGVDRDEAEIIQELVQRVRDTIGPVAAFKNALIVPRLPKTRSGKVLRATMKKIADGEDYKTPATIDDPAILTEIGEALSRLGYPAR